MSSEAPDLAPAHPPSDGHASDHDSSGDENEKFGSFSAVQVVKVVPSTIASSAVHSSVASDALTSGHASGKVEPQKGPQEDLKFKIACMPILRLKVCPALADPIILYSSLLIPIYFILVSPRFTFFTQMLKTKSSRADFFHKDQKRVLILNGLPILRDATALVPSLSILTLIHTLRSGALLLRGNKTYGLSTR
jgi:hypothetical protein